MKVLKRESTTSEQLGHTFVKPMKRKTLISRISTFVMKAIQLALAIPTKAKQQCSSVLRTIFQVKDTRLSVKASFYPKPLFTQITSCREDKSLLKSVIRKSPFHFAVLSGAAGVVRRAAN